jgi:hypothetical protein
MLSPKSALTVVAAAFAVVATGSASYAQTDEHRDAARDIVSRSLYSDAQPKHPEPDRRLGDIVRNSVPYGADLVVTTKYRRLSATGHQEFSWFVLPSDGEDNGYWTKVESYISSHSSAEFTHCICPACAGTMTSEDEARQTA